MHPKETVEYGELSTGPQLSSEGETSFSETLKAEIQNNSQSFPTLQGST